MTLSSSSQGIVFSWCLGPGDHVAVEVWHGAGPVQVSGANRLKCWRDDQLLGVLFDHHGGYLGMACQGAGDEDVQ